MPSELEKFLESMKRSARRQKNNGNGRVSDFTSLPRQDRYALSMNTGLGEDNRFQPDQPTHLVMTDKGPRTIHEKEQFNVGPERVMEVIPASELGGQNVLSRYEKRNQIRGYQEGTQNNQYGYPLPTSQEDITKGIEAGTYPGYAGPTTQEWAKWATTSGVLPQEAGSTWEDYRSWAHHTGAWPVQEDTTVEDYLADTEQKETDYQAAMGTEEGAWLAANPGKTHDDFVAWQSSYLGDTEAKEAEYQKSLLPEPRTDREPLYKQPVTAADEYQTKALGRLSDIMEGGSAALDAYWTKHLDDLAAVHGTEEAVFRQQLTQGRVGDEEAAARLMMLKRSQGVALSEAEAQALIEKMKLEEQAAKDLHSASLAVQMLDFQKQKYGDDVVSRISQDIANGATYETMKAQYPSLTEEDYNSIREAGELGERDWDRKMTAVETLISAGGPENLGQAATMLNDMFPGMDIEFSKLLDEEKRADFGTGLANMASYIAAGLDWNEAVEAMRKDGTFGLLGMDETAAKKMYDAYLLNTDPVYRAMHAFDDETLQTMFPDIAPDKARALIGKLSVFGAMTIDENGKLSVDTETLTQLFGEGILGEGVTPTPEPTGEKWDSFLDTVPSYEIGEGFDEKELARQWEEAGKPLTWDEFEAWRDERRPEEAGAVFVDSYGRVVGTKDGEEYRMSESEILSYFKGADSPSSANHDDYLTALDKADPLNLTITSNALNLISDMPSSGTIIKVGDRLFQVGTIWRRKARDAGDIAKGYKGYNITYADGTTGDTGEQGFSGREGDRFELIDLATGTTQTFVGTADDIAAGKSINNISSWAATL